ncbi:amino acid adenylation domain-containing protein [Wukongibacter sp. M2B1]|uniref:amino acid adenylation domain-containing protein n=1 Tax=Wukongibacter sp. M2B1 TaxID=3088895 RepID=UPI003D7B5954|nr:NRPS [Wukongibacter baidiensis]
MKSKLNKKIEDIYSLTPMQEGMLYHRLIDGASTSNFSQSNITLRGEVNIDSVKEAIQLLADKYEILRTSIFHTKVTVPRQLVFRERGIEIIEKDILKGKSDIEESVKAKEIEEIKKNDIKRGFDLEKDSLLRITIIKTKEKEYYLIWSFHHIIMDGWCLSLIYRDFMKYYREIEGGYDRNAIKEIINQERENIVSYGQYIRWLEKQDKEEALNYFKKMLDEYEEVTEIPPLGQPSKTEEQVKEEILTLDSYLSERLREICTELGVTMSTIVEGAWAVVLQKYNNSQDVVFGRVVSGRNADILGIEQTVGLFVNTIPSRIRTDKETTCKELLKDLQKQNIESTKYEYCSLVEIQNETLQGHNLIKTLYVFENYYIDKGINQGIENIEMDFVDGREQTSYDISLSAFFVDKLNLKFLYNPGLFRQEEITTLLERLEKVLGQFVETPNKKVNEIEIFTESEQEMVLYKFNDTKSEYPEDNCVHELFEEQAAKTPKASALVFGDEKITYEELNTKANQLARRLRKEGIQPNDYVGVMIERSIEMIIGIYGVMKAGAAYVPIDPSYPRERIKLILEDCKPQMVLAGGDAIAILEGIGDKVKYIDIFDKDIYFGVGTNLEKVNSPKDNMYLIYTSGSSGKPKAVIQNHRTIVNLMLWQKTESKINLNSNILLSTTISFDVATQEIVSAFLCGGTAHLISDETKKDIGLITEYLEANNINVLFTTPSYFDILTSNKRCLNAILNRMTDVILAGEAFYLNNHVLQDNRKNNIRFHNHYGPSETHVVTNNIHEGSSNTLTIGKPIANTRIYILNENNLCGIGIPGELCIAGHGLSQGYLNQPELTKEKFVENPYIKGECIYRTGDLARWLTDGNIEYIGRIDEQVKIRGFRIELGEIENVIKKQSGILNAVVIVKKNEVGNKVLCGYIVSEEELDIDNLKENIRKELPDYMIPAFIMQVESIPVTKNGKLNKRALPEINIMTKRDFIAPRNEIEKALASIFKEILGIEKVGVKDVFFEIGGDSLKAMRVTSMMREMGYELNVRNILLESTLENIAKTVEEIRANKADKPQEERNKKRDISVEDKERLKAEKKKIKLELSKYHENVKRCHIKNTYEPFEFQKYFLSIRNNLCPTHITVKGTYKKKDIIGALNKLIGKHSVLRSSYDNTHLIEYDKGDEWYIPYIDLCDTKLDMESYGKLINDICMRELEYREDLLINEVIVIRTSEDSYQVFLFVQHALWDFMSTEIFEELFEETLNANDNQGLDEDMFSEYVSLLKEDMSSKETEMLMRDHSVERYIDALEVFSSSIDEGKTMNSESAELKLESDAMDVVRCNPILWSAHLLKKGLSIENDKIKSMRDFPVSVLYHGRDDTNSKFLGLYVVIVPLIMDEENLSCEDFDKDSINLMKNIRSMKENRIISELIFRCLPDNIPIPPYINFKGIYRTEMLKEIMSSNLEVNAVSVKTLVSDSKYLGIDLLMLDNQIHVTFPTYTQKREALEDMMKDIRDELNKGRIVTTYIDSSEVS